jgi:hypothetical protein
MGYQQYFNERLPSNIDAERAVLGAILLNKDAIQQAANALTPGDFFHTQHQNLFAAMLKMREKEHPIDILSLNDFLESQRSLEHAGGAAYISTLVDGVPNLSNVAHYILIVKEKARLRSIIHVAHSIQQGAFAAGADLAALEQAWATAIKPEPLHKNGNGNGNGHLGHGLIDFLGIDFPIPAHLVEGLIPKGGSVLFIALPHHMKSLFTTSLALACTRPGMALGKLEVKKPVRTMLVQVEELAGDLQGRIKELMKAEQFLDCDPSNLWIIDRTEFEGFSTAWYERLVKQAIEFRADFIILDVLRRIFVGHGDINSPKDTSSFLEKMDDLRDSAGAAIGLVHHENKKDADIMNAAAGSYNFPGWANVMVQFKRKVTEGNVTHVEINVDNKLARLLEPMRMTLDLTAQTPVRVESLGEGSDFKEAMAGLDQEWTVQNVAEHLGVHRSNAQKRVNIWLRDGKIEKIKGASKGRRGGLARYRSLDPDDLL